MRKWVASPAYRIAIQVVADARRAQGLTQREVESRLGKKHHGWLAKIEAGERQMNIIDLVAIARAIGADERKLLDDLIGALPDHLDV